MWPFLNITAGINSLPEFDHTYENVYGQRRLVSEAQKRLNQTSTFVNE